MLDRYPWKSGPRTFAGVRRKLTLTGHSPRPRPSRKISDQFRTGVPHRKHFDFSMPCIRNEIVEIRTQTWTSLRGNCTSGSLRDRHDRTRLRKSRLRHLAINIEAIVATALSSGPDGIPNCSAAGRRRSRQRSHPE